jgi:hypothetical protein
MLNYIRLIGLALLVSLVTGCVAKADGFILESYHPEVLVANTKSLPSGPNPIAEGNCQYHLKTDLEGNSKAIAKSGWGVTSVLTHGPFELVSFAGSFNSITSGMCIIEQTNIAVFQQNELIGLFYTLSDLDHKLGSIAADNLGKIQVFSQGGFSVLSFEIIFRKNRITLDFPSDTIACEGDGVIPNLTFQSIFEVKRRLANYGWQPTLELSGNEDFMSYFEKDPYYNTRRIEEDLPELITCSGTGMGYCKYLYEREKSYLEIITVSDGDMVISLNGFCR